MQLPADQITDETPVPLSQAVELFFPMGGMTKTGLMAEHRKGRLKVERIAGRLFVTRKAVSEMRQRCLEANDEEERQKRERKAQGHREQATQYALEVARRLKTGEPMPGKASGKPAEVKPFRRRD